MGNIANNVSYDYQNIVRDIQEQFEQLKQSFPTFLSLVPIVGEATNTKVEWLEDTLTPTQTTIASFDTDGDGTGINVASTAGIQVGSILRFTTSADVSRTEQVQVASVDSATDLTVVRDYGGTTGVTLVVGDKVFLVSTPRGEKTDPIEENGQEPDPEYNYMQIFDAVATVSKTAEQVKMHGIASALDYQVAVKLIQIMRAINSACIYGRRVARSSSQKGTMGGVLQYISASGGNIETTGGAVSPTIINNMMEMIFEDGGFSNSYVLMCAENQARKISAFNTTGDNPRLTEMRKQIMTYGQYISKFIGDLPVQTGFTADIVVDANFPKDQLAVLDMNRIEIVPLSGRGMQDSDATLPGGDYYKRRILTELSLRVKNGKQAHAIATGLDV